MKRNIENSLVAWKNSERRKPLILYGARQTGKTYALLKFGKKYYSNVAYFYFENNKALQAIFNKGVDKISDLLLELSLFANETISPHTTLIIFDEIQSSPAALSSLKRFFETAPEYHIASAGSLLGLALARDAEYSFPVGKVDVLNMYPMTFDEFLLASGKDDLVPLIKECYDKNKQMALSIHDMLLKLYRTYCALGGMPEVVHEYLNNKDFSFVTYKQLAIYDTYCNDMVKYCSKTEAMRNIAAFGSIPSQLAKPNRKFQYSVIEHGARSKNYAESIAWLTQANIILKSVKITAGKLPLSAYADLLTFKIYMGDTGLLCARGNYPVNSILGDTLGGEAKGALTENYVAQELAALGHTLNYWESSGSAELDFVIQHGNEIIPVEVKSGTFVRSKSLMTFLQKYGINKAVRISSKNFGYENGIKSVPLYAVFCIKELTF